MSGYKLVNLKEMVEQIGEERTKAILSDFSCSLNPDIEKFLKTSAIPLSQQAVSTTYLVFTSYQNKLVLIGYFSIASKTITITSNSKITTTLRKRINKFATYNHEMKCYIMPAPLIAQLGKNFTNNYNQLISGSELLDMALEKIKQALTIIGGKIVYVECEDNEKLIDFYQSHSFYVFDKRILEKKEKIYLDTPYLQQMIKYIK